MPKVIKLLDLGSFDNGQHRPPFLVPIGSTVIGRGDFLKCKSTEVSRSHALLEADKNGNVKLTTDNKKPCYYKHGGESDKKVLKQNESVQLHHGDVFSLTATSSGYEVQVSDVQGISEEEKNESGITPDVSNVDGNQKCEASIKTEVKRKFPDWMNDSDEEVPKTQKKHASSIEVENQTLNKVMDNVNVPSTSIETSIEEANCTDDQEKEVHQTLTADNESGSFVAKESDVESEKSNDTCFEPEEEAVASVAEDGPSVSYVNETTSDTSTSVSTPQRPPCKYAETCYRKNPQHKADFCHPGDPDYTTLVATPKLRCQYGTSCYRVNPQHKQDFDHTQPPITPPQSPKKKVPRTAAQRKKTVDWDSGSEESYDESFIDDNSSDDYHPDLETESEDEDWE